MVRMTMPKRRVTYVVLLLITIPVGLAWRMVPLGLSPFWLKFGGSALWAMALYWFIAVCLPRLSVVGLGCLAAVVAVFRYFNRLRRSPALYCFRLTLTCA